MDGARDLCNWVLECDSCERMEVDRCRPSSSVKEEVMEATEGARRSSGDGSSGTGGEMGVTLFLRCFLVKSEGFLPKMEVLGEGEGSGIIPVYEVR